MPESTFFDDLLAAQKEMPQFQKTAINPFFKSKYVPLEDVLPPVLDILHRHNFILMQCPTVVDGKPALGIQLLHKSGEKLSEIMLLMSEHESPQGQGAAITYARRYSLMALLGLTADLDDDAEATRQPKKALTERPTFKPVNNEPGIPDPPCPEHGNTMKYVNAGTSKKTGKAYSAFYSCDVKECEAGKNGRSYTIFEDNWIANVEASRGEAVQRRQADMDVAYNE